MQMVSFILFVLAYLLLAASGAAMGALVVSAVLGVAAAPFMLLFLAARGATRLVRARGSRAFAWQPGDWGAEPLGPPDLRVSSSERDRAAAALVRHWHEGRLSVDELEERIERALRARTRGELELLRADLP